MHGGKFFSEGKKDHKEKEKRYSPKTKQQDKTWK